MTDEEAEAAGGRIAACPGWRWLPRMLDTEGAMYLHGHGFEDPIKAWASDPCWPSVDYGPVSTLPIGAHGEPMGSPDLRDPATMGAAITVWQSLPHHVFTTPCPVLSTAAAHGLTHDRTIRALVEAFEASASAAP